MESPSTKLRLARTAPRSGWPRRRWSAWSTARPCCAWPSGGWPGSCWPTGCPSHIELLAVVSGRPDRPERRQGVIGAFAAAGDAPELIVTEGAAAVEVADAVGAPVGRRQPIANPTHWRRPARAGRWSPPPRRVPVLGVPRGLGPLLALLLEAPDAQRVPVGCNTAYCSTTHGRPGTRTGPGRTIPGRPGRTAGTGSITHRRPEPAPWPCPDGP